MPKGKPWTVDEEKQLKTLLNARASLNVIAAKLQKSKESVRLKIKRMGIDVVDHAVGRSTSSRLSIPDDLPSVEEALHVLCDALDDLNQKGLDQTEVLRLRTIIQGIKIYKELFADYVNYRGIEAKMIEMEEKYERLAAQAKSNSPKPDDKPIAQA